ncbi:hypothetical protein WN48_08768 [Eufriesea mexicana]|nr:hypothetical protein WN48_08768 [Eufriesea mexicana]
MCFESKTAACSIGVRYIGGHGGVYVCLFASDQSVWLRHCCCLTGIEMESEDLR